MSDPPNSNSSATELDGISHQDVPTIMMVDDNQGDIELVRLALQQHGIRAAIRTAASGPEAFYHFREFAEGYCGSLPDLVLLDLNMPSFNGFQLLGYIRTQPRLSHITIVMLSSTNRPKDCERAIALGAVSYLVKPLNWPGYATLVEQLRPHLLRTGLDHPKAPEPEQGT